ncbi:IQ motif and SEC7 domain-containing protein 1-like isoform X1 [Tachypleus tridentatus]|uniref:IQ motif and SEC7 domain-containing protein 1-like isoform X1 n=1 Tax=Tachypleus tridentatus TaxID=6853 RepID=UPI003FCFFDAB
MDCCYQELTNSGKEKDNFFDASQQWIPKGKSGCTMTTVTVVSVYPKVIFFYVADNEHRSSTYIDPVNNLSGTFVEQNCEEYCGAEDITTPTSHHKMSDLQRKGQYRVGLNFNKKPEKGISYLIQNNFLKGTVKAVPRFLISKKGLCKQSTGEYLRNLQNGFNSTVLK